MYCLTCRHHETMASIRRGVPYQPRLCLSLPASCLSWPAALSLGRVDQLFHPRELRGHMSSCLWCDL